MSFGTILIGTAVFLLIAAYVGRPFRRIRADVDHDIEKWISVARNKIMNDTLSTGDENTDNVEVISPINLKESDVAPVNFCPHCGRRVEEDHRFCPGCGKQLVKEVVQ